MLSLFGHTITLGRDGAPPAAAPRPRRRASTVRRASALAAGACALTGGVSAHAATGGTPGPAVVSATVSTSFPIKGVNVTATGAWGFAGCTGGSSSQSGTAMGFPNATCSTAAYTVSSSGNTNETISVEAASATPNQPTTGTAWQLCGGPVAPACGGAAGAPGADQYTMTAVAAGGGSSVTVATGAQCDVVFTNCQAVPVGGSDSEKLGLVGPQSSTDQSPTFSMLVEYIAS